MRQQTVIEELERDRLVEKAKELCGQGYRLVQMMGNPREDTINVIVSFDKNYELLNYRIRIPRDDLVLPSITGATLAAFSYENELQDLFGFKVTDLAINYGGNFLRTKMPHPLADLVDTSLTDKARANLAAAKKAAAEKAAAAKAAGENEQASDDGRTVKTIPLTGVNCETDPDIDNPAPDKD
jgi:hypothetical protein